MILGTQPMLLNYKERIIISTCGFYTTRGNYESVDLMFDHFLGKFRVPELSKRTNE